MADPVVEMTPLQYWSRWALAGCLFLIAEFFVIRLAIIDALITVLGR